jgi:DNA-directed RNA polymerase specialized sigma24 family protein
MGTRAIGSDEFDALLRTLGSDREQAGHAYEELRRRLVTVFAFRGCAMPDTLADETLDRVARKVAETATGQWTDLRPFVFGVAWNVARESFRTARTTVWTERFDQTGGSSPDADDVAEQRSTCLDRCLGHLRPDERQLVLDYFQAERSAKIALRSAMAARLRISPNALRIRICRMTAALGACLRRCLDEGSGHDRSLAGQSPR